MTVVGTSTRANNDPAFGGDAAVIRLLKPTANPEPLAFLFAIAQASGGLCHCLLCGSAASVLLQEGDGANLAWLATVTVSPLTSASRQCMSVSHPRVCLIVPSHHCPLDP